MATITLQEFLDAVPHLYAARDNDGHPMSYYLRGPSGCGKTSAMMRVPGTLEQTYPGKKFGIVVVNAANLTLSGASGYMDLVSSDEDAKANRARMSRFSLPFWWITSEGKRLEEYDGGIIYLDEEDKGLVDVKKILGEAKLSRRLCSHVIPEGWQIWSAGNRPEDRCGSTKELDHLINRTIFLDIRSDVKATVEWMHEHGMPTWGTSFVDKHPELVFNEKAPEKQGAFCSPRSFFRTVCSVMPFIKPGEEVFPDMPITRALIYGGIGEGVGGQLFLHIKTDQELPKYEDVCKHPATAPIPVKPDAVMLMAHNLAWKIELKDAAPVIEYMLRMPKEFSLAFAKTATKRVPMLVNTKAFQDWCKANASLATAVLSRAK